MAFEYVKDIGLKFTSPPAKRKATKGIVIHHFASESGVQAIHNDAISRLGWIGIGYNVVVLLDGSIVWGRGLDTVGAHAGRTQSGSTEWAAGANNNAETVGVAFQGYYHPGHKLSRKTMPAVQYAAGVKLLRDLLATYPGIWVKSHGDMPATNTACPGSYMPMAAMITDAKKPASGGVTLADAEYIAIQTGAYKVSANAKAAMESLRKAGFTGAYAIVKDIKKKTYRDISL